jgi:ParB family chromosome partitioning protein
MAFQGDSIYWVEVEKVVPNPFQPRREFDENKLRELSDSIRMYGVLQPLTVTRKEVQREDGTFFTEYELIAGERRLRASKMAGVAQVPVIIREGEQSEQEKLELAIIENLQREDLNAVDRALAFRQLADAFGLSHAQVAEKVGRSREYVSNSIRLLGLPDHMLDAVKHADISEGHARTLLMLNDKPEEQEVIFKEIKLKKLSVREVERIVRKIAADKVRKKNPGEFDASLIEFEKQFTETLGTRVQIQKTDFGGKLTIDYFSTEDLEAILERMKQEARAEEPTAPEIAERLAHHTPMEFVAPSAPVREEVAQTPPPPAPAPAPEYTKMPEPAQTAPAWTAAPHTVPSPEPTLAQASEVVPAMPTSDVPTQSPDIASESVPATHESVESVPERSPDPQPEPRKPAPAEESDDSGLYSIRNFTV